MTNEFESKGKANLSRRGFLRLGGGAACTLGLGVMATAAGALSPTVAYATVEGDQTPLTDAEIEAAIRSGEIQTDSAAPLAQTFGVRDYAVRTIAGASRYETSAEQTLYAFSNSAWAIVASGVGYADSICAAGLAGALGCPIILTEMEALPSVTSSALKQIGAKNIILLGSEAVASARVEQDLRALVGSSGTVERVYGPDRYATQMAVYEYGKKHDLWTGDTAVVANATGFADALSVSPISYKLKAPVFYVDETTTLPKEQEEAIRACGKKKFIITGDTVVMSDKLEELLSGLGSVKRLGGSNRYETSRAIASYAVSNLGMTWDGVAFTSGTAPYDALGGGPVQGKENSVLCLMEEDDYHYEPSLPFSSKPASMKFFGDKAIYSSAFKTRCALKAGFAPKEIWGLSVYVDAGHGGNESGAVGSGYVEKNLTRELADMVRQRLAADYGISTATREDPHLNDYKLRHPEAKERDCGLFVSIHFNAAGGSGTESYVHTYNSAAGSKKLQDSVHRQVVSALGLKDRGKLDAQFAVTSGPLPSMLLEVCFIDSSADMSRYQSRKSEVAAAIARGIAEA